MLLLFTALQKTQFSEQQPLGDAQLQSNLLYIALAASGFLSNSKLYGKGTIYMSPWSMSVKKFLL